MYVLINCSYDGDTYQLFTDVDVAVIEFNESMESDYYYAVYLLKPEMSAIGSLSFGFGSRGDVFGADTILEWRAED